MTKDNMIRFEKVIDHFRATAAKEMVGKAALAETSGGNKDGNYMKYIYNSEYINYNIYVNELNNR